MVTFFRLVFDFLRICEINGQYVTCFPRSPAGYFFSILWEYSMQAYKRVIDLFFHLCDKNFSVVPFWGSFFIRMAYASSFISVYFLLIYEPICHIVTFMFNLRIHACHHSLVFSNPVLSVALSDSGPSTVSGPSSSPCKSFIMLFDLFSFSVMFFLFTYFTPKLFWVLCILLLDCPHAFSTNLLVELSFVIVGIITIISFNLLLENFSH